MWITTTDGALINLDQCHAMHMKEFRGGFAITFDTAAGHAVQVKSGTQKECREYFDEIAKRLTSADSNSLALVIALEDIAKSIKDKTHSSG